MTSAVAEQTDWTVKTYRTIAEFFGVRNDTVRREWAAWMPGQQGKWNLSEIAQARIERAERRGRPIGDDLMEGAESPALEEYRKERTLLARMDRLEREQSLISRDEAHKVIAEIAGLLRGACEQLERRYDAGAREILEQALDGAEKYNEQYFGQPDAE